ncbi:MAG: hypothetical protein ACFBZ8_09570 [Opitutales bacterium]
MIILCRKGIYLWNSLREFRWDAQNRLTLWGEVSRFAVPMRLDGRFRKFDSHYLESASPDISSRHRRVDESQTAGSDRVSAGGLAGGLVGETFDAIDPSEEASLSDIDRSTLGGAIGGGLSGGFIGQSGLFNPSNSNLPIGTESLVGFNAGIWTSNGMAAADAFGN